jgi:hypothetical protein
MMKEIALTQGKVALVDDADYGWLNQWKWTLTIHLHTCYAYRMKWDGRRNRHISMHRLITGAPKGQECDHINGNGLDNRRSNLRVCTHLINSRNRHWRVDGHRPQGVSYRSSTKKWIAYLAVNRKRYRSLSYGKHIDAEAAYNALVKQLRPDYPKPYPNVADCPPDRPKQTYKLSPGEVSAIRERYAQGQGTMKQIGMVFGVSESMVSRIISGERHTMPIDKMERIE